MSTWIIGHHDEWMHHPIAVIESEMGPELADPVHDWAIELDDWDFGYMAEYGITELEYVCDLAYDGQLTDRTGKHEPYADGEPRWEHDENIMRIWDEMGNTSTDSIYGHRED